MLDIDITDYKAKLVSKEICLVYMALQQIQSTKQAISINFSRS